MPAHATPLPLPRLVSVSENLTYLTDPALADTCGVTIAFTGRAGGISPAPFDRLNLSGQVGDDPVNVDQNRTLLRRGLGIETYPLVIPHQVHGTDFLVFDGSSDAPDPRTIAPETIDVDAVVVGVPDVAAMLCFADCVPVIIAAPSGRFAVIHAGWRGVYASISRLVAAHLAKTEDPAGFNVYLGPHIGPECFECAEETHRNFREKFGEGCVYDNRRIDLAAALRSDLTAVGIQAERICDCGICTVDHREDYFSYRAEDGYCGRQSALAFRTADASAADAGARAVAR